MAHGENPPINITPGAIRFNTDSMKLEYFRISTEGGDTSSSDGRGTLAAGEWVQITTDTPDIQTGGTRGLRFGGEPSTDTIDYITISTTGNAIDFGNLSESRGATGSNIASRTRGVTYGGYNSGYKNEIEFVTIPSTGNVTDFGNLLSSKQQFNGCGNATRGVMFGGTDSGSHGSDVNTMEYIIISQTGNSVDFGDCSHVITSSGAMSSSTRGIIYGGIIGGPSPANTNLIDFFTISTLGNSANFGDATAAGNEYFGGGNSVRGIAAGARTPSATNVIEYITIAALGNAQDFGDLTTGRNGGADASSPTRVCFMGGATPTRQNIIDYVEIMSKGNAIDFGDLTQSVNENSGCSNGHGGLG